MLGFVHIKIGASDVCFCFRKVTARVLRRVELENFALLSLGKQST